jgi:hypothetical protein
MGYTVITLDAEIVLALDEHYSTAMKRQGEAPPFLILSGRIIILTRRSLICPQFTKHLPQPINFLINAP